jgi:hypothetical protein
MLPGPGYLAADPSFGWYEIEFLDTTGFVAITAAYFALLM